MRRSHQGLSLSDSEDVRPHALRSLLAMSGLSFCVATLIVAVFLSWRSGQEFGGAEQYVRKTDFLATLTGDAVLASGHPYLLYDEQAQLQAQGAIMREGGFATPPGLLRFNHPPHEAIIALLVRSLGISAVGAFVIWVLLSLAAFAAAIAALLWAWPLRGEPKLTVALASVSFFPFLYSLMIGQCTAVMLYGLAVGSALLRKEYDVWAGAAFGLAAIKPQTVPVVLLVLLVTRRWRAIAGFALALALAILTAVPWAGWDWPFRWIELLLRFSVTTDAQGNPSITQTWFGLFDRIYVQHQPLPEAIFAMTVLVAACGLLGWVWWPVIKRRARAWNPRTDDWSQRWACTLLVALLVDAHLMPQDVTLAIVPTAILATLFIAPIHNRWRGCIQFGWLWLGWLLGFVVVFAPSMALSPGVLWMTLAVGWITLRLRATAGAMPSDSTAETARLVAQP